MSLWTRIRGALGIAVMWAVLWQLLICGFALYYMLLGAGHYRPFTVGGWLHESLSVWPLGIGLGFVVGMGFSLLVASRERDRTVHTLSTARVAIWGALASGLLGGIGAVTLLRGEPDLWWTTKVMLTFAPIGAASAAGTLALARGGSEGALLPGSRRSLPGE